MWGAILIYGMLMLRRFGWTVGMLTLCIRVCRGDGSRVGYGVAAVRTLVYVLPLAGGLVAGNLGSALTAEVMVGVVGVGLLWMIVDSHHQAYHDKIAGTFVVRGLRPAPVEEAPARPMTPPASRPLRMAKWAVFLMLGLVALSPLGEEVAAYRAGWQINAILAQLKADGKPLTEAALVPPPIPDAENAALVYEEAVKKWQSSPEEQATLDEALSNWLRGRPLGQGIAPDKLAALKPPPIGNSTDARVYDVVNRTLERSRHNLALLHKAAGMEKWRSLRKGESNLPRIPNARRSARRLALEAMVRADEGDADAALRAAMTPVDLSNFLDEPQLIVALVRMIMCNVGVGAVERVLFDSTPSPDACRAAEAALGKADLRTALVRGVEGERAWITESLEKVRRSPNPVEELAVTFLPPEEIVEWPKRLPGGFVRWRMAADELYCLTYMGLWIRQMQSPVFEQDPRLSARLQRLQPPDEPPHLVRAIWHPLSVIMLPMLMNPNQRVGEEETAVALARVALLLKAYRAERGAYPESLSDLGGYLGKELPLDPCSGKPFRYRREGSGFILYSVGLDGVDDGGARPEKAGPIPILGSLAGGGKDIVWVCKE